MIATAVWVLLLWHGGLDAWQQAAAALLLACLVVKDRALLPSWRFLGPTERALLWCLLAAFCGLAVSLRPQATVNGAAALGLGLGAALVLRRGRGLSVAGVSRLLMLGGACVAAAFLACGLLAWACGGDASPVTIARWFFPNQNLLAAGLALPTLLLGLAGLGEGGKGERGVAALSVALGTLALVYAGSRGAFACFGVALLWLCLRRIKSGRGPGAWALPLVAAMAALTVWAPFSRLAGRVKAQAAPAPADDNYYRRADFWKGALGLSLQRPVLGYGLGAFAASAYALDLPTALTSQEPVARYRLSLDHAHNEWLETAVEGGWPVTLTLLGCALAWLFRRWRFPEGDPQRLGLEAVVVAAGALSLVDMNLRTPALGWGLVLCFCALEAGPAPQSEAEGPARPAVKLALWVALLAVVCGVGAALSHDLVRRPRAAAQSGFEGALAMGWQPLDPALSVAMQARGLPPWPWAAWAGRNDPAWWWNQALQAQSGQAQEADAQKAMALRPYFAPGWYWLGLKQAQNGEADQAGRSMAEALRLEPNFCRVLVWMAGQARAQGRSAQEKILLQRAQAVQDLRPTTKDDYVRYIQAVDIPAAVQHPSL